MIKILHISDLHFGPFHWYGNDDKLLEKINSYDVDLVINTGDCTSDGLEREYKEASNFLKKIKCAPVISIIGNHDKRSRSSVEFFKKYINDPEVIYPREQLGVAKKRLFLSDRLRVNEKFTDINFIEEINIKDTNVCIIGLDSNVLYSDDGFVEINILNKITEKIKMKNDCLRLVLIHHSILGTDQCPLLNSQRVIDFINKNDIFYVFCGHTHEIDFRKSIDIINGHVFYQFMCGSTSSNDMGNYGRNVFVIYEILDEENINIKKIDVINRNDILIFQEEEFKLI